MKIKYAAAVILAAFSLTACGKQVVPNATVKVETGDALPESYIGGSGSSSAVKNTKISTTSTTSKTSKSSKTTKKEENTTTAPKAEPPKDLVLTGLEQVEIYQEISLDSFITDKNVELKDSGQLLDTSTTGEHTVNVAYLSDGNEFSKELKYNVADTTPPLIINEGWDTRHLQGSAFDLNNYVGYGDNYDKTPTLTYSGDIDPNTVGIYPLHATVTDSSGNSSEFDVSIQVLSEIRDDPDENPRVDFKDFIKKYDSGNEKFGIDVSTWQGDIDFEAVKNAGCQFVIMRIGVWYNTYGEVRIDDWYQSNIEKAEAAGLDVGVYFYTTDNTPEGIKEHCKWIADTLGDRKLDYPVAFDWEEWTTFQEFGMSLHDLNELYRLFASEMESYGHSAMLYSSRNLLRTIWDDQSKRSHTVWLAHFVDDTDYEGEFDIWQASCYGNIDGIAGDVDMNIQYNDRPIH